MISHDKLKNVLGVPVVTIRAWKSQGLPYEKSGRTVVYDPCMVAEWFRGKVSGPSYEGDTLVTASENLKAFIEDELLPV